jgi:hypothetical protein
VKSELTKKQNQRKFLADKSLEINQTTTVIEFQIRCEFGEFPVNNLIYSEEFIAKILFAFSVN